MSTVGLANEHASIVDAFIRIGMVLPQNLYGSNIKLYCPFGEVFHADGGMQKALRIYPETNSAYCFAQCGYLSPVKVVSMGLDMSSEDAAELLLESINYAGESTDERWEHVEKKVFNLDKDELAEALKTFCNFYCISQGISWDSEQFNPIVSSRLKKCLGLIELIKEESQIDSWLTASKSVMKNTIGTNETVRS